MYIRLKRLNEKLVSERRLVLTVLLCIVIAFGIVMVGLSHVFQINDSFAASTEDDIKDEADFTTGVFSDDIGKKKQLVLSAAYTLSSYHVDQDAAIFDALGLLENSNEFDYSFFISTKGVKYRANGNKFSARVKRYTDVMDYSSDIFIFENFDTESGNKEICFGAPVVNNGMATGFVIGVSECSRLFGSYFIDGISDAERFLIDKDGKIIYDVRDGREVLESVNRNMFTDLFAQAFGDMYMAEEIHTKFDEMNSDDEVSRIDFTGNQGDAFILFKNVSEAPEWTLVFGVYKSAIDDAVRAFVLNALVSILLVILLMVALIIVIFSYMQHEQNRIHILAYVDELTGAANETAFIEKAEHLIKEYPDTPYMMCCYDVVNFRYINEGYGHEKADMLLRELAKVSGESFSFNETFGRVAADEFVALLVDDGRLEERREYITEHTRFAMDEVLMNYPIRIKAGLYYIKDRTESISSMIDKANLARKSIDSEDRYSTAEYREQLTEETRRHERIESRMESALLDGEFVPFLQPKWDMKEDKICGAEALVRWRSPEGLVPPGDFIPVFEQNGFIERLDFYMLESVCSYLRKMIDEGRAVYPVSVNQSRFLLYDPEYISKVQQIMLKYKIPKDIVELEITETVFFNEKDRMLEVMRQLKEFNINLSIDDFGSGYSSLNLLRDIPFDVLKIDRGFLDESVQSESGKWILKKIVEMANGLNMKVICEGVETREQVDMLLGVGCIYAQGFLYSRPIPLEEYIEKYNVVM